MRLGSMVLYLLGPKTVGFLEYWFRPKQRNRWGGPFNGQNERQKIFRELYSALPFSAILETGTYRGDTTAFFRSASGLQVFSAELNPRSGGYSKARFLFDDGVHLYDGDSRSFLRAHASRPLLAGRPLFIYLDAHWNRDLPLRDELQIIRSRWPQAVVMIDDFQVPDDQGYGYDDYGDGNALTIEYLRRSPPVECALYFPAARSEVENGRRRGSALLTFATETKQVLNGIRSIRAFQL